MNDSIAIKFRVSDLRNDQEQLEVARRLTDLIQHSGLNEHVGIWMQGDPPELSVHAQSEPRHELHVHPDVLDDIEEQLTALLRTRLPHAEFTSHVLPEALGF